MSVKLHLTSGASVHPENTVMYSADNGGQNICGVFSETAPLQRSSTAPLKAIHVHMVSHWVSKNSWTDLRTVCCVCIVLCMLMPYGSRLNEYIPRVAVELTLVMPPSKVCGMNLWCRGFCTLVHSFYKQCMSVLFNRQ